MEKAVKSRAGTRMWVTRAIRNLDVCIADEADEVTLKEAIAELDKRLEKLEVAQTAVEMETDVDKLEDEINSAADFVEKARESRLKAQKLLTQRSQISSQMTSTRVNDSSSSLQDDTVKMAKLPKLQLPKFSGDVKEWQSFWDQFVAIVDNSSDLPVISKFTYLQALLEGEAKSAIQGLSITADHYKIACDILIKRFGRKERIIFSHIQELLNVNIASNKQSKVAALWQLQDNLQAHIRSLEALGVRGEEYGVILTPLILSRLPADIRLEWAREGESRESDLKWLMDFLHKEIERRERSQAFKDTTHSKVSAEEKKVRTPTVQALQASSVVNECGFCAKQHPTDRCWEVTKLPMDKRQERIRTAGLCFRCLQKGHIAKGCAAKCSSCKGRHHKLCCKASTNGTDQGKACAQPDTGEGETVAPEQATTNQNVHHVGLACASSNSVKKMCHRSTILQVAHVGVNGKRGIIEAAILFDTGSDRSYVSSALVRKVKPEWVSSQTISYAAFGAGKASREERRNIYRLDLKGDQGGREPLTAIEVPIICAPVYRTEVPGNILSTFGELHFATDYSQAKHVSIDILVGIDYYWKFVKPNIVRMPGGLVAQDTVFGWVVSGSCVGPSAHTNVVSHQLLCLNDVPDSTLRNFWDLESIGIYDQESVAMDPLLDKFNEKLCFSEGRYEVALPWKDDHSSRKLLNNKRLAEVRCDSLTRKLSKDPILEKRYNEALSEMEINGVIEEVPEGEMESTYPTYYMPHRPVVREASVSTKIRPVFDASATGYNGVSLNDCLETGPNLIPNLGEILIRFRRWRVALTADITKAFLQIKVRREDQDVHRFLWKQKGATRVMRFVRVPFGNKSSPFLLNATIQHHLSTFPNTRVVRELKENLYVDDWLSGADTEAEACEMLAEANQVMNEANMQLAKWGTNSDIVSDMCYREFEAQHLDADSVKVLGIKWMPASDCFSFEGIEIPVGLVFTKRVVLSLIARLFDPLGFAAPFVMTAKFIFQELWKLDLRWDIEVPKEIQLQCSRWVGGIPQLQLWQIPRAYSELPWQDLAGIELHGFGDASERGYGACVYLRIPREDGSYSVSLVISKGKVAPIKKVTLPRLELLAALLCARLLTFVRKALKLPADVRYRCWTDSMVTLGWIQSDPSKWKMFVANRTTEIQGLTNPACWFHCPGKENPADLVSRGMFAEDLVTSKFWLEGPEWLSSNVEIDVGVDSETTLDSEENVEKDSEAMSSVEVSLIAADSDKDKIFEVERWGKLDKALRIVGWVCRFIRNARYPKSQKRDYYLSYDELSAAKVKLFKCVQLHAYPAEITALQQGKGVHKNSSIAKLAPFLGSDGLVRIQGRLQFSELSYEEKHPIILPDSHLSLLIVRSQHHRMKHAGVSTMVTALRSSYWIVGLRRLAKRVKRECIPCQKQDARSCCQPMAPLPALRTNRAPPFSVTGLDYAGPLYCADFPGRKFYILLCTCAVVRAVHLELVDTLSLKDFMLAIRRFSARRGLPSVIYSDNAKTFVGAQVELQRYFGDQSPKWKFIVPRSPWWGGWWERLVRSVKSALKKSVGSQCLTRSELETTLQEIEACVNSRPLTVVGDEPDLGMSLTPSHFLIGRNSGFFLPSLTDPPNQSRQELVQRDAVRRQLLDRFWALWSTEYLRNLPPLKGSNSKGNIKEGSVVLVREDGIPRLQWPIGVITKLYPGKDGVVRAVDLKTARGTLTRPIQRLHSLEICEDKDEDLPSFSEASQAPTSVTTQDGTKRGELYTTRAGRNIKPRERLDL